MFTLRNNRGFALKFDNGIAVSIIFGYGSHSSNYCEDQERLQKYGDSHYGIQCPNAEVAIFDDESKEPLTRQCWSDVFGEHIDKDIVGFISTDDLAKVIAWAENYKGVLE